MFEKSSVEGVKTSKNHVLQSGRRVGGVEGSPSFISPDRQQYFGGGGGSSCGRDDGILVDPRKKKTTDTMRVLA